MTEKQKKFLELVNQSMPHMTEKEQEKLLTFGEALVFLTTRNLTAPFPGTSEQPCAKTGRDSA